MRVTNLIIIMVSTCFLSLARADFTPTPRVLDTVELVGGGSLMVVRDATDCSLWHYVPSHWVPVQQNGRTESMLRWRKEGHRLHPRYYPETIITATYAPLPVATGDPALLAELLGITIRFVAYESERIRNGSLQSNHALYAGICNGAQPRLVPLSLEALPEYNEKDPFVQRELWSRFTSDGGQTFLTIGLRHNPLLNGKPDVLALTTPGLGVLPGRVLVLDAVRVLVDAWMVVQARDIARFQSYVRSTTYCDEHCWQFLFWGGCDIECHTISWTEQFFQSLLAETSTRLELTARGDLTGIDAALARQSLMNDFIRSNFTSRVVARQNDLMKVEVGTMVKESADTYKASLRKFEFGKVGLVARLVFDDPLPAAVLKPVLDFMDSETYRCAKERPERGGGQVRPGYLSAESNCPPYPGMKE